jgi:hypothetical protein
MTVETSGASRETLVITETPIQPTSMGEFIKFLSEKLEGSILKLDLQEDLRQFLAIIAARAGLIGQFDISNYDPEDAKELFAQLYQALTYSHILHTASGLPGPRLSRPLKQDIVPILNLFPTNTPESQNSLFTKVLNLESRQKLCSLVSSITGKEGASQSWDFVINQIRVSNDFSGYSNEEFMLAKEMAENIVPSIGNGNIPFHHFNTTVNFDIIAEFSKHGLIVKLDDTASGDGVFRVDEEMFNKVCNGQGLIKVMALKKACKSEYEKFINSSDMTLEAAISQLSESKKNELDRNINLLSTRAGIISLLCNELDGKETSIQYAVLPNIGKGELAGNVVAGTYNLVYKDVHRGNVCQTDNPLGLVLEGTVYEGKEKEFNLALEMVYYFLSKKSGLVENYRQYKRFVCIPFSGIDVRYRLNEVGEVVPALIDFNSRISNPGYAKLVMSYYYMLYKGIKTNNKAVLEEFLVDEHNKENILSLIERIFVRGGVFTPPKQFAQMRYTLSKEKVMEVANSLPEEKTRELNENQVIQLAVETVLERVGETYADNDMSVILGGASEYHGDLLIPVTVCGDTMQEVLGCYRDCANTLGLEYDKVVDSFEDELEVREKYHILVKYLNYFQPKAWIFIDGKFEKAGKLKEKVEAGEIQTAKLVLESLQLNLSNNMIGRSYFSERELSLIQEVV